MNKSIYIKFLIKFSSFSINFLIFFLNRQNFAKQLHLQSFWERKKRNFQRVLTLWSLIHSTRGEPLGIPCSLGQLCESALIGRGPTMHFKLLFLFLSLSFPVLVISASFQRFPTACALEFEKEHRRRRSRDLIKTTLTISRSLVNSRFRDRLLWSTWFSFSFDLFNGDCFNSEWRNGWRWNQRLGTCKIYYWASNLSYQNWISHRECFTSRLIVRQLQLFPRRCPCSPWVCARICCNCAGAFKWLSKMVGDVHLQRNPSRALSSEDKRAPLLFHAVFLPFCLVPFSFHPSVPSTPTKTNSENECPRVTRYTVFLFS